MLGEQQSILELATALARVREREVASLRELCDLLDTAERCVFRHKDAFGVESARFQLGCEEFVLLSNTVAMQAQQQQPPEFTVCAELLARAEQHTRRSGYLRSLQSPRQQEQSEHASRRLELRLICLNNLACLHKEIAKPLAALGFLEKALKIQVKQAAALRAQTHIDAGSTADAEQTATTHAVALTHLNLCAVLSQLKRHNSAAEHAKASVALLATLDQHGRGRTSNAQLALVAHYNWGVELEHLHDGEQAMRAYTAALHIAQTHGIARSESELVRSIEEIVREHQHVRLDRRAAAAAAKRAVTLSRHRPRSPRSLRTS